MEKTCQTVAQVAGHSIIQSLKEKYPDKFTSSKLEKYIGADVSPEEDSMLPPMLKEVLSLPETWGDVRVTERTCGLSGTRFIQTNQNNFLC